MIEKKYKASDKVTRGGAVSPSDSWGCPLLNSGISSGSLVYMHNLVLLVCSETQTYELLSLVGLSVPPLGHVAGQAEE